MADGVAIEDIADIVYSTRYKVRRQRYIEIASRLQRHECLGRIMRKDRRVLEGSRGFEGKVLTDHTHSAHQTKPFAKDSKKVTDLFAEFKVPHRFTTGNFSWSELELDVNKGPEALFKLIKGREDACWIDFAEHCESQVFGKPADSTDDETVWGFQYWLTRSATTGFNGGNPSGFTAGRGGLSSLTHTRHQNYTGAYADYPELDELLFEAALETNWESPIDISDYRKGRGQTYRMYANKDTMKGIRAQLKSQNDDLGWDLNAASPSPAATGRGRIVSGFGYNADNVMTFNSAPVIYVPALNTDSAEPLMGINFDDVECLMLDGQVDRVTKPKVDSESHTTWTQHIDWAWNLMLHNLRRHFVLYKT